MDVYARRHDPDGSASLQQATAMSMPCPHGAAEEFSLTKPHRARSKEPGVFGGAPESPRASYPHPPYVPTTHRQTVRAVDGTRCHRLCGAEASRRGTPGRFGGRMANRRSSNCSVVGGTPVPERSFCPKSLWKARGSGALGSTPVDADAIQRQFARSVVRTKPGFAGGGPSTLCGGLARGDPPRTSPRRPASGLGVADVLKNVNMVDKEGDAAAAAADLSALPPAGVSSPCLQRSRYPVCSQVQAYPAKDLFGSRKKVEWTPDKVTELIGQQESPSDADAAEREFLQQLGHRHRRRSTVTRCSSEAPRFEERFEREEPQSRCRPRLPRKNDSSGYASLTAEPEEVKGRTPVEFSASDFSKKTVIRHNEGLLRFANNEPYVFRRSSSAPPRWCTWNIVTNGDDPSCSARAPDVDGAGIRPRHERNTWMVGSRSRCEPPQSSMQEVLQNHAVWEADSVRGDRLATDPEFARICEHTLDEAADRSRVTERIKASAASSKGMKTCLQ